uniref:AlNc14C12G1489 protein n=1 Tax=Albugo laibachii Nc14 TaxID=890382 RepID=F0W3B2_9STRA|nr:AlNc14C12G1489 [Albugo laibachii Nc14]|eukprot:CCA15555.1 AlNc14C12G1489 [Albugo laibachii Nc14]
MDLVEEFRNDDTAYSDDLQTAARAGIRLLEENAHLTEEIEDLTNQYKLSIEEIKTLTRLLDEKDNKLQQVTKHIKESIMENQQLLTENRSLKVQVRQDEDRRNALRYIKRSKHILNVKRNVSHRPKNAIKRRACSLSDIKKVSDEILECSLNSPHHANHRTNDSNNDFKKQKKFPHDKIAAIMRPRMGRFGSSQNLYSNYQSLPSSPVWGHGLSLEKDFKDNRIESGDRKTDFERSQTLLTKIEEADKQIQNLRTQLEESEEKVRAFKEEQAENFNLIESLRNTLQMYQQGGTAQNSITLSHDVTEGIEASFSYSLDAVVKNAYCSRRSLGYNSASNQTNNCSVSHTDALNDDSIDCKPQTSHQNASLASFSRSTIRPSCGKCKQNTTPEVNDSEDLIESVSQEECQQVRFLNDQITRLQQLLEHHRLELDQTRNSRTMTEKANKDLSAHIEVLQRIIESIKPCLETGEWVYEEKNDCTSAGIEDTNGDESHDDDTLVSILKFFIDSWTTEQTNRMYLHDWLVNALLDRGKRKPLFLNDLTPEISRGFRCLFVPILRQYYGLDLELRSRKRHVIVTDLRLQTQPSTSSVKTQAQLQKIHRSMFLLDDIECKFKV